MQMADVDSAAASAAGAHDDPLQAARAIYAWVVLKEVAPAADAEMARALSVIVANAEMLMQRLADPGFTTSTSA
jgi:hypothetical protein